VKREIREVTCIICPVGCRAKVVLEKGRVLAVESVECPRGKVYAISELKAPVRDFFSTVRVRGAKIGVLPVRTTRPIPKDKVMDCSRELSGISVEAPVRLGQIIARNVLGLGVDVIATRDLDAM
jgi:CxxC motif-containing protein